MKKVQILILKTEQVLISEVISVMQEIGEPDCKLIKPRLVVPGDRPDKRVVPWLDDYTEQDVIMIRSDDVLTFVEPTTDLLDYYITIT
tara:strand:- start:773 stop:1036 length:264 start_codon:yes stop_codon:yes gene_type:complete